MVFFRYCQYGNLDSWISIPCQENKFRLGFSVSWLHEICERNLAVVYYHGKTPPGSTTTRKPETTSEHLKAYGTNPFKNLFFETVLQEVKYEVQAMGARWASVQIKGLHYFRVFWKLG